MQGLLDFPLAVLARVLDHVPTQQRLSQCVLVCQHFAAAAVLATGSISICSRRSCCNSSCKQRVHLPKSKVPALQAWIGQHAGQLVNISFCGKQQLQLPCADLLQLTSLELDGQMLLLQDTGSTSTHAAGSSSTCAARVLLRSGRKKKVAGPARQHLAPVAGQRNSTPMQQLLPKLQQLDLSECKLRSVQPLLQLSRLTSLTSLNLGYGTFSDRTEQPSSGTGQQPQEQEQPISTAICTMLPHLKRLGALQLRVDLAGTTLARVVQQFSHLPQLCSFAISISDTAAPTDDLLAGLPSGLTRLEVWDVRDKLASMVGPASFPGQLPQLSSLQELEIANAAFYPSMLRDTPHLRCLDVQSCKLLPGGDAAADRAAAAALLAAVGCLKHLTELCIRGDITSSYDFGSQNLNAGEPTAYTALTASSTLHSLTYEGKATCFLHTPSGLQRFMAFRVAPHIITYPAGYMCSCPKLLHRSTYGTI
mgnify:CR=1 FL=1